MKWMVLVVALMTPIGAHAQEKTAQERLFDALGLEWFIANCDQAQSIPAMGLMVAAMTISGSTVHDVEATRSAVRERISTQWPNPADACTAFASSQSSQQPAP